MANDPGAAGSPFPVHTLELERHLRETNRTQAAPVEPATDMHSSGTAQRLQLGTKGNVRDGRVQSVLPGINWYRVALDDGDGVMPCCRLFSDVGTTIFGCHDASVIQPDNRVLVYIHQTGHWGIILGVIPEQVDDANFNFPDWVVQGGNAGLNFDAHHYSQIEMTGDEAGARDWSNHRPYDETVLDWGRMTELGGGVHLDPDMAFVRIDELTGVFAFYVDQHLRVAGHRLSVISACHTEEYWDDEGENTYFRGETPYPWEMLGAYEEGDTVHRDVEDEQVLYSSPYAKQEPAADDQQPFYRYEEYGGYLGQARVRLVTLPPESASGTNRFSSEDERQGVFREQLSLDGHYAVASAKGIVLAKRSLLPVPKRVKPANDYSVGTDAGDARHNENYKFAGVYGNGDEHKIGDIGFEDDVTQKDLVMTAAVLDSHAHLFNWKGIHPFYYHENDFSLPEEADLQLGSNQVIPHFDTLASDMWLSPPDPIEMKVDHRYGDVRYYPVYSHVTLQENGAVVIEGGLGESIRMEGGSIILSCPGNVMFQPGRSLVGLAGDDIVMRAMHSIDITSALRDIRLKAERNMQFLASNGSAYGRDHGCMLFESRAEEIVHSYPAKGGEQIVGSGILFKAPQTQVVAMAKEIYLRTGNTDGGVESGPIVLDASRGESGGVVHVVADKILRFINTLARDGFGKPSFAVINEYSASEALFGGQVGIKDRLVVNDEAIVRRRVSVPEGEYYSASGEHVQADPRRGQNLATAQLVASRVAQRVGFHQSDYQQEITRRFHANNSVGGSFNQSRISFSLRNEEQYGTQDFELPECHWQRLANLEGSGSIWEEPTVSYQGKTEMMPWPGKDKWSVDQSFLALGSDQFSMYDLSEGVAKARFDSDENISPYEDPKFKNFDKKVPNAAYRVISTP